MGAYPINCNCNLNEHTDPHQQAMANWIGRFFENKLHRYSNEVSQENAQMNQKNLYYFIHGNIISYIPRRFLQHWYLLLLE